MLQVKNISDAVVISYHTGQFPIIAVFSFQTGTGSKVLYRFPDLPENFELPKQISLKSTYDAKLLLENFDDLNRLQVAVQSAYREWIVSR